MEAKQRLLVVVLAPSTSAALNAVSEARDNGGSVLVASLNLASVDLTLCWVDEKADLHHHYRIAPGSRHVEMCGNGDAFLLLRSLEEEARTTADVPASSVVCGFHAVAEAAVVISDGADGTLLAKVQECAAYSSTTLAGFTVQCADRAWDICPRQTLEAELRAASSHLPPAALAALQADTCIWLSDTPRPADSAHTVYHPCGASGWLLAHGKPTAMAGSVEICRPQGFLSERGLWAQGGLLLHELSHAWHDKQCDGGHHCAAWARNYERAMRAKLYDYVAVHGTQGRDGPIRAYACENPAECFAELSVAFLGEDGAVELNKWWPHNRPQLTAHDPESVALLEKLWGTSSNEDSAPRVKWERVACSDGVGDCMCS